MHGEPEDIQCYAFGDSVLVTYLENIPDTREFVRQSFWVFNHSADSADLDILGNHLLSGVTRTADNRHFYYYIDEENKKNELRAFNGQQPDSVFVVLRSSDLRGELLAVINDKNLSVISFDTRTHELHVLELSGPDLLRHLKYQLDYDLSFYYKGAFAVLSEHSLPTVAAGSADFKLYKTDRTISITIDQNKFGKSSRTEIITLDLDHPGKPDVKHIRAQKREIFRSFLSNDTLYRVAISRKKIAFTSHDVSSGRTLSTLTIGHEGETSKTKVTKRLGHLGEIARDEDIEKFMATSGNFFPSIFKWDARFGGTEVVIGSYIYSNNTGSGTGGLGLGRMISYHHPSTSTQSAEPIGVSKYFLLVKDGQQYKVDTSVLGSSISKLIDTCELGVNDETKITAKAYANLKTRIIAVYSIPNQKRLSIVEFKK